MKRPVSLHLLLSLAVFAVLCSSVVRADASSDRHFTLRVLPLLEEKCFACHGEDPDEVGGELDLRSQAALLKGGESKKPALVPGKPTESLIYSAIRWDGIEMPPKENDRLTAEQVSSIERWIVDGAPWPDAETRARIVREERSVLENEDGVIVPTSTLR